MTPLREFIRSLARDILQQLDAISTAAATQLRESSPRRGDDALAIPSAAGAETLRRINYQTRENDRKLTNEPAIARVVLEDDDGQTSTWYICRATPATGFRGLASYRSPIGRIASLEIGSDHVLPDGKTMVVLEQALLRPSRDSHGWDSPNTIVKAQSVDTVTVDSLRALLVEAPTVDILDRVLATERAKAGIVAGIRRRVIDQMTLRDQPVLDQYQDSIFRLPLDQRLLILGPAGTGKTTTLIRRLGQKLDIDALEEGELRLVGQIDTDAPDHKTSWIMFTPTELLQDYVKEAFAREGVPASDQNIRTWKNYRRYLGREELGVLKAAERRGIFIMRDHVQSLGTDAMEDPCTWFDDFNGWQRDTLVRSMHTAAQSLAKGKISSFRRLGRRLADILERPTSRSLSISLFSALATEIANVRSLVSEMKKQTDGKVDRILNLQLNRNGQFLEELAQHVSTLKLTDAPDTEEDDDDAGVDEEESIVTQTATLRHVTTYRQTVRAQARAAATGRKLRPTSRSGRITEWLGDRTLGKAELADVGANLIAQKHARRFIDPVKLYIGGIPARYRRFRRARQMEARWYTRSEFRHTDIHPLEVDVVLLAILRAAGELLDSASTVAGIDEPAWSHLKTILALYRNQILVDEATDFSPLQLACMSALAHPRTRSFFACGDFNQRLTTWGARSSKDLKWACPDITIQEITVSYRQTKQLSELSRAIIQVSEGTAPAINLPANVDTDGVRPALLEESDAPGTANWLARRIREIDGLITPLPSTAVFVKSEADVSPVAEALREVIADDNINVVACPMGKALGQDNDVRVFDVQHIKGLEFEAVFFVAIDRLASEQPALFGKYLYVGASRAATYLGVTCERTLPHAMEPLREHFGTDWS